jgi:hypothetical protein
MAASGLKNVSNVLPILSFMMPAGKHNFLFALNMF